MNKNQITFFCSVFFLFVAGAGIVWAQSSKGGSKPPAVVVEERVPAFVERTFTAWDVDKNGMLSRSEFEQGWKSIRRVQRNQQQVLRERFGEMDRNRNQAIDSDEYQRLVLIQRAGSAAPPLSDFDTNGNGKLELDEYLTLVHKQSMANAAAGRRQEKR